MENPLSFLGIFLVGLGLNLTPCVYPMLSLTVALFGKGREANPVRGFFKALVFVFGMALTYSSLGVTAALTGSLFGSVLSSPFVLAAIGILFSVLSLGMFGLYNFQFPSAILNRVSKRSSSLVGLLVAGLFAGVFAAPCIGPPIVALLTYVGTKGDPVYAFWIFFLMSIGLGLPYLVLGTFSGLLSRLPKAGVWLVWVERIFGVLLIFFAAFYFWLALRTSGVNIPNIFHKESVKWEAYSPEKLELAKTEGRPVVMDFYADWCIPCHELDQFTYTDKRVILALEPFARFKVDMTEPEGPESEAILEKFEIEGVPTVIFIDAKGNENKSLRTTGYINADEMLEKIEKVKNVLPSA